MLGRINWVQGTKLLIGVKLCCSWGMEVSKDVYWKKKFRGSKGDGNEQMEMVKLKH